MSHACDGRSHETFAVLMADVDSRGLSHGCVRDTQTVDRCMIVIILVCPTLRILLTQRRAKGS